MLHVGDDDLIPRATSRPAISMGNQIGRLRRATQEDALTTFRRIDERRDPATGPFVGERRLLAEQVDTSVDIGVVLFVESLDRFDDGTRFLCRRRIIEIDQAPITNRPAEDREITPDRFDVESTSGGLADLR